MKLYHTSPVKIEKINSSGRFGEFLFFSSTPYEMSASETITYSIEINESEIIEAGSIFFDEKSDQLNELVEEVAELVGVDHDTATDLIDETENLYSIEHDLDPEDIAEASWDIQRITAQAAEKLGYKAVEVEDEQGTSYMINMSGREMTEEVEVDR